ncbi:MAG: Collagen adhesin [Lactococcus sp.]
MYAKDLSAHWYFEIPTGENVAPGDTMTVKVPEVLALQNTTSFNILDESGEIIGTAVASPDTGNVVITFTEAIRNAQKVKISGQFNLDVHWDHQKVNFGETTQIDWTANITSTVQIDEGTDKPDENEGIKKWGYIDAQDPSVIHWTARVNFSENLDTTIKNAIYQDELGPNQELVAGSISGFYVSGWEDNWFAKAGAPIPSEMIDQSDETHFKVTFGDLTGCVYINYSSRITDGVASDQYSNLGTLTGDDFGRKDYEDFVQIAGGGGNSATNILVAGEKRWRDNDNAAGMRPESIVLELYQNDEKIATQTVTADADWHFDFGEFPNYDNNQVKYRYRVEEVPVPNYTATTNGFNITNT